MLRRVLLKKYEIVDEFSKYFEKVVNDLDLYHSCSVENIIAAL